MKQTKSIIYLAGIFILFLFSMSSASASQAFYGNVNQGQCINLVQTCDSGTFANISSIRYPNSSIAISNITMSHSGTEYAYTFCDTMALGDYWVHGYGDCNAQPFNFYFTSISPSGSFTGTNVFNNTAFIILAIVSVGVLIFALSTRNIYFSFISGAAFLLLGVYTFINGFGGGKNVYTDGIAIIALGFGIYLVIASAYEFVWGGDEDSGEEYEEE